MINVNGRALSYDQLNSNIRILCTLVCGFLLSIYKLVLRDKIFTEGIEGFLFLKRENLNLIHTQNLLLKFYFTTSIYLFMYFRGNSTFALIYSH